MSERRVVITGLGPVSPLGIGVADYWNGLLEGRSAVRRITEFDPSGFASQIGAGVADAGIGDSVPKGYRKAGKIMARDIVLAVIAAHRAVQDSGLITKCLAERGEGAGGKVVDSARLGANIGAASICADLSELSEAIAAGAENGVFSLTKWGREAMEGLTPLWLLKFLPNMLACHVTIVHDAQGPSNTITCGEASSHLAIGEAFRTIARGVADVCLCGGAESKMNPMAVLRQALDGRLSTRNDAPQSACRPFGAERDGTAASEGGGLVVLEELEHARQRGARIYAELIGFGASNEAFSPVHPGAVSADGRGLQVALKKALRDARHTADQVDLYGAFACGLKERDAAEAAALRATFGGRAAEVPVLVTKGGMGNNGAGSGALDFIATILALHHGTLPPAVNAAPTDPAAGVRLNTSGKAADLRVNTAASAAYALTGGQNAALVIQRYRG